MLKLDVNDDKLSSSKVNANTRSFLALLLSIEKYEKERLDDSPVP